MVRYSNYSELQDNILQEGDKVMFHLETGEVLDYEVIISVDDSFFLCILKHNNALIFEKLNLDKNQFCKQHYGYDPHNRGAFFPETKPNDFAALTRLTLALFDLIETPRQLAETSEILFID